MTPFLSQIAERFIAQYGKELSAICFVFPNRRSGIFFQKYLSEKIKQTVLSPKICTISEFFGELSPLQSEDKLGLLFRLYLNYIEITQKEESFDDFIGYGEIILNDFKDVDNYLVDAKQLFSNVKDLNDLNDIDYLNEEQKEAIIRFWKFSTTEGNEKKETQEKFYSHLVELYPLYSSFKEDLLSKELAYDAMSSRYVVEHEIKVPYNKVVFIGFNALNETEKALFVHLKKQGKADFYWDYNSKYVRDVKNAAHRFMEYNLNNFPSQFSLEEKQTCEPQIKTYAVPSAVGQTKLCYDILNEIKNEIKATNTAIVLSDEKLLLPSLYAIPPELKKVNVTMGYPLRNTPIQQLTEDCLALQKNHTKSGFYFKQVLSILSHPYVLQLNEPKIDELQKEIIRLNLIRIPEALFAQKEIKLLSSIFQAIEDNKLITYLIELLIILRSQNSNQLESEFLLRAEKELTRTNELIQRSNISVNIDTLSRIVRQLLYGITVAFEGEPLGGLQIMGMLETRCLDFQNLIVTSFNEGIFPKTESSPSFIPYNLRRGFDLPTTEHQDAVFAYHFYRLIQRAKRVYLIHDTRTESVGSTGEESRFTKQLRYLYNVNLESCQISYTSNVRQRREIQVEKTTEMIKDLHQRTYSASGILTYLKCPLRYYFQYIEKAKEQDEILEAPDKRQFGTIYHTVMEDLYKGFQGEIMSEEIISQIKANTTHIEKKITKAFAKEFFKNEDASIELKGNNYLIARILAKYIDKTLEIDKSLCPITLIGSEINAHASIEIDKQKAKLFGVIDRIDKINNTMRIVDYKSGKIEFKKLINPMEFVEDKNKGNDKNLSAVFQLLFYAYLCENDPTIKTSSSQEKELHIYSLPQLHRTKTTKAWANNKVYNPSFSELIEDFEEALKRVIEELWDMDVPFKQNIDEQKNCKNCPYKNICL